MLCRVQSPATGPRLRDAEIAPARCSHWLSDDWRPPHWKGKAGGVFPVVRYPVAIRNPVFITDDGGVFAPTPDIVFGIRQSGQPGHAAAIMHFPRSDFVKNRPVMIGRSGATAANFVQHGLQRVCRGIVGDLVCEEVR